MNLRSAADTRDIYVRNAGENKDITFVADIGIVSDYGIEERNPYNFLYEEILESALKLGIDFSPWFHAARLARACTKIQNNLGTLGFHHERYHTARENGVPYPERPSSKLAY
jgi:hypothetical protein